MTHCAGVVNFFDSSKGFGFIASQQIQGDVFFGRHDLPAELKDSVHDPGFFELRGREVLFRLTPGEGKQHAREVVLSPSESMPVVGTVVSYNDQTGYGFISVSSHQGGDVFFSWRDIPPQMHALDGRSLTGKTASFSVIQQAGGKPQAKNLKFCKSGVNDFWGGKGGGGGGWSAMGGKGGWSAMGALTMGGITSLRDGQGAQGTVTSYNAQRGFGFISCEMSPGADLYFKSTEELPVGTNLAFYVKIMPDGKPQARDLVAALSAGQTAVGTVIRYVPQSGYGFIRIPNQPNDVNFRKDDVPPELQEQELEGKTVRFNVKLQQGRPQVSTAQFLPSPPLGYVPPSMDRGIRRPDGNAFGYAGPTSAPPPFFKWPRIASGAGPGGGARQDVGQMTGWVVSFNATKGFGFIQSPMSSNGDVYFKAMNLPAEHQRRNDMVGAQVSFRGSAMPDGKLQANAVKVV